MSGVVAVSEAVSLAFHGMGLLASGKRMSAKEMAEAVNVSEAHLAKVFQKLVKEGLAREFVRRVQDLRKTADLDIADRIRVAYRASAGLEAAVQAFQGYISSETLAVELTAGKIPANVPTVSDSFDGEQVTIAFVKAA